MSGSNSEWAPSSSRSVPCGEGSETKRRYGGACRIFCWALAVTVMWVLISGLRVLSDSWVFRVLICAEAAIGFGGGPVLNMPWPLRSRMQYDYKQTNHDVKAAKWSHVVAYKALELPKFTTSLTLVHSYLTGSWVSDMSKP